MVTVAAQIVMKPTRTTAQIQQSALPLLRQKNVYQTTKYGYARGDEAVTYVENIRRYYDTLLWVDERQQAELRLEQQKQRLSEEISAETPVTDNSREIEPPY